MTDNKIIRALECCIKPTSDCENCPYYKKEECFDMAKRDALNLINRQQVEIERLNNNISAMAITLSNSAKVTRAEAIKEVLDKLKDTKIKFGDEYMIYADNIDVIEKEMMGEDK